MTLITTFLRTEFAIIFADKKAITSGSTTVTVGGMTINSEKGMSIVGYNKLTKCLDGAAMIGIAGDANWHTYVKNFSQAIGPNEAIEVIEKHLNDFQPFKKRERSDVIKLNNRDQALMPFYDSKNQTFALCRFNVNNNFVEKEYISALDSHYILRYVGSGASAFQNLLVLPSVNGDIEEFNPSNNKKGLTEISDLVETISKLYLAVSAVDKFVSPELSVWVATKDSPIFTEYIR